MPPASFVPILLGIIASIKSDTMYKCLRPLSNTALSKRCIGGPLVYPEPSSADTVEPQPKPPLILTPNLPSEYPWEDVQPYAPMEAGTRPTAVSPVPKSPPQHDMQSPTANSYPPSPPPQHTHQSFHLSCQRGLQRHSSILGPYSTYKFTPN